VRLVRDMQEAHMNMVRVWGGGVYPPDAFFEACDTAGILVWQDLMFANTMVPDDEAFRTNVQEEAADQVRRIQHHACLALWCGNNEVEVAWRNWGWQRSYGMSPADSIRMWNGYSTLFNEILRDWIWVLDRDHAYVPTSPQSNWGSAEGLTKGDLHYWGVWHGDAPFGSFASNVGRFVSEYGFQSYPSWTSIVEWSLPADRAENGPFWKDRQKSYKGDKAITDMAKRYGMKVSDRQDLVEVSQKLQAKAYSSAIGAHQANWPRCAGTLLWQLNDCWPGPSWSIIEYGGRRKPAYTIVQELYAHPPDR
jgi:beta-mannosidase